MIPFPQTAAVVPSQVALHLLGCPLSSPSSQVSPALALTTPSPHAAGVQSALHSALSPPSSHTSPSSMTPLPHSAPVRPLQLALQYRGSPLFSPSSQISPASLTPLPQRSEEHTSELQSRGHLVCRLLLEKK